jgi:hypothetical protein
MMTRIILLCLINLKMREIEAFQVMMFQDACYDDPQIALARRAARRVCDAFQKSYRIWRGAE